MASLKTGNSFHVVCIKSSKMSRFWSLLIWIELKSLGERNLFCTLIEPLISRLCSKSYYLHLKYLITSCISSAIGIKFIFESFGLFSIRVEYSSQEQTLKTFLKKKYNNNKKKHNKKILAFLLLVVFEINTLKDSCYFGWNTDGLFACQIKNGQEWTVLEYISILELFTFKSSLIQCPNGYFSSAWTLHCVLK